jgi:tetratricopeptide (TPR) repeat protein
MYLARISKRSTALPCALLAVLGLSLLAGCHGGEMSELDKALSSFRSLPLDEQEPALRAHAAEHPGQAQLAWYELGNVYYGRAMTEVVPPGEGSPTATNALLDSALVFFERAFAADSTFVEPLVNAGLIWDDLSEGRTPEARNALTLAKERYTQAILIRPDDEKARCNLGALYFRRHQYTEALEQYRAVLEVNPKSALAHYNLGIMFVDSKLYDEAIVEWEAAAKADPDGDVGDRARENIEVIHQLMTSEIPAELEEPTEH